MKIEKLISPFIEAQFPSFYREEGPNFVLFVKAYYEWMEQSGNVVNRSRLLMEYTDIDETSEEFIKYFKNTFISSLPSNIVADKRLLIKHITELYQAKGTKRAYELLFRLVFNEDIDIYIPGNFLFKTSSAKWTVPEYIEVADSEYLEYLPGKEIRGANATAIVEKYFIKVIKNQILNIVYLSNIEGRFKYGEQIYCDDLYVNSSGNVIDYHAYSLLDAATKQTYDYALNDQNAPLVFGSLSAIGIINGGANFNVGDLIPIEGTGLSGIAKVVSTRTENGKVTFSFVDGGYGFTTDAIVTVTGGSGIGASFKVGGITNKSIYQINTDVIDDKIDTQLDIDGEGFYIYVDTKSGSFISTEYVSSSANVVTLDVVQTLYTVANGDVLSNTSLNIDNLYAYWSDGSYISVTGADSDITNANLVPGTVLESIGGAVVTINTVDSKRTLTANGEVVSDEGGYIWVRNVNSVTLDGNPFAYVPGSTLTGLTSGETANVTSVERLTDWLFPKPTAALIQSNLDTPEIGQVLNLYDLEVGAITYITAINPGVGYSSNPTVDITEPLIYNLRIEDGKGGFYGHNAVVTAKAGTANGIVTGIVIADSGFGYNPNETVVMNANTGSITGAAVVDLNGSGTGHWETREGFLSDLNYLQDSDYRQIFSYEIIANRMLDTYQKMVLDLIHPAGIKLFGKFTNRNYISSEQSVPATNGFYLNQS